VTLVTINPAACGTDTSLSNESLGLADRADTKIIPRRPLPILTFGTDDLLDPTRLSLLPLSPADLVTVLAVGSLVGVAPIATLLAAVGPAVGVVEVPGQLLAALVAAVLEVAFRVVLSRVVAAALSGLLTSRSRPSGSW